MTTPTTGFLVENFFNAFSGFFLETGNMINAFKSYQKADNDKNKRKYLIDTFTSASLAIEHLGELVTGPLGGNASKFNTGAEFTSTFVRLMNNIDAFQEEKFLI